MKIFLNTILIIFTILSLILLYFGVSHLISSIILHFAIFYFMDLVLRTIFTNWGLSNFRLTFWTLFIGIMFLEFTFRFITKNHLSYFERNDSLLYIDPYRINRIESFANFKYFGDAGLWLSEPNSCRTDQNTEFTYEKCYNSDGIREREITKKDVKDNLVILTLGDSFTEGIGAPVDSTWTSLLLEKMKEVRSDVTTINCGRGGSDVIYEWYKLKTKFVEKYKPDIVIIAINNSDIQDLIFRGGKERFSNEQKINYKKGPIWSYPYALSHIYRFYIHKIKKVQWNYLTNHEYPKAASISKSQIAKSIQKDLKTLSDIYDFKLMIVFTPTLQELEKSNELTLNDVYQSTKSIDSSFASISLFNTYSNIKEKGTLLNYFWPIDRHCKSKGYDLWSKEIYHELLKQQWLTKD